MTRGDSIPHASLDARMKRTYGAVGNVLLGLNVFHKQANWSAWEKSSVAGYTRLSPTSQEDGAKVYRKLAVPGSTPVSTEKQDWKLRKLASLRLSLRSSPPTPISAKPKSTIRSSTFHGSRFSFPRSATSFWKIQGFFFSEEPKPTNSFSHGGLDSQTPERQCQLIMVQRSRVKLVHTMSAFFRSKRGVSEIRLVLFMFRAHNSPLLG